MARTFSRDGYASILDLAREVGYEVRPMRDALTCGGSSQLLLRHDVDFSLRLALDMALFENERDVTSTYYVLPHNDFYAPFSSEGRSILARMTALGHEIGLHWDSTVYPEDAAGFRRSIERDVAMLEEVLGQKVRSASQHNPIDSRFVDLSDLFEIEAYSARVRERFAYVSDSAMSWRAHTPWDVLPRRANLQLLIHPIWWMTPQGTRGDKFAHLKRTNADDQNARLDDMLAYIERCLVDRERLDAHVTERWKAEDPTTAQPKM
jgi:hypothetical protein